MFFAKLAKGWYPKRTIEPPLNANFGRLYAYFFE